MISNRLSYKKAINYPRIVVIFLLCSIYLTCLSAPSTAQTAEEFLSKARQAYISDDEKQSYDYFLSAIRIFQEEQKMDKAIETWTMMGFWWSYWSKPDSAEVFYNRAEELLKTHDFGELKAMNSYRQGMHYRKRGRLKDAIEKYRETKRLAVAIGDSSFYSASLNSLGLVMKAVGRLDDAYTYIDSAITIARENKYHDELNIYLGNLAGVYGKMGNLSAALNCYIEAERLGLELGNRHQIVRYGNIGEKYFQLNQTDEAVFYQQKAYQSAQGAGYPRYIISRGLALAESYMELEQTDKAEALLNELLPVKREFNLDRYDSRVAVLRSQIELASGSTEGAIESLKSAVENHPESQSLRYELARMYYNLGQKWLAYETLEEVEWSPSPLESIKDNINQLQLYIRVLTELDPVKAYQAAVDATPYLDQLQNRAIGSSTTNASFLTPFRSIYRQMALLSWKNDRPADEVYNWMQQAKGVVFEMEREEHNLSSPQVDSLRFVRFQLEEKLKGILVDEPDLTADSVETREERIQAISLRLDVINSKIRSSVSGTEQEIPTLSELRERLENDTQIIEYLITEDGILRFTFTREIDEISFTAINRDDLKTRVTTYSNLVRDPGESVMGNQLHSILSQLLLPDIISGDVIISPDGILHYIPFETLRKQDSFLIRNHSVSYILSSRYYAKTSDDVTFGENERLLMVANPEITSVSSSAVIPASVPALPFASLEADSVSSYFGDVVKFSREQATRSNIEDALKDTFDVLHIASHGVISDESPLLSGILLADDDPGKQLFSVSDINRVPINAKLVMLSSCNSASGTFVDGEGFLGLQRSFLSKKIPYVGASLWSVNDESTAMLMNRFYEHLFQPEDNGLFNRLLGSGEPKTPEEAMQMAKRSLMNDKKYRHPYYWAPFIVIKGI